MVQDPATVGTAFKTISMRIRGAKTELEEAGLETEGMVDSTAKLREEILALSGVDIMENANEFKSTYKIMDELAAKWKGLTDIQQASVTELIAGKRQGNIVSSLMTNFDTARKALETSLSASDGIGSAMEEHAKWSDSLEARLNKLKSTWQSFAQTFMNSDLLKGGIDLLSKLVEVLEKLIDTFGSFGTIGLGVGIFNLIKSGGLKTFFQSFSALSTLVPTFDTLGGKIKAVGGAAADAGKIAKKSMGGFSALATGIGLAVAAFELLYNAYKNHKEAEAAQRQEAIDSANEFLDAFDSFELAYIKYSDKTSLTAEEEAELETAIKGTVDALGEKSSALKDAVESSDNYLKSLEEISQKELQAAKEAAQTKRAKTKESLIEAAIGYTGLDGSEVDVKIASGAASFSAEVTKIADEFRGKYKHQTSTGSGVSVAEWFKLPANADVDDIIDYYNVLQEYKSALLENNLEETDAFKNTENAIGKLEKVVGEYQDAVVEFEKADYRLNHKIPQTLEEYISLREEMIEIVGGDFSERMATANSLDEQYGQVFDLSSIEFQARKFDRIISAYGNGSVDGTNEVGAVETFLNLRTAVNNDECSVGDYLAAHGKLKTMQIAWDKEEKEAFESTFNLDGDEIYEKYSNLLGFVSDKLKKNITDGYAHRASVSALGEVFQNLTATELEAAYNLRYEINWENANEKDIRSQIEEEVKLIEAMSFSLDLTVETTRLQGLDDAVAQSLSGAGLSIDSEGNSLTTSIKNMYSNLEGYDSSKLFERTANGIRLNADELRRLEDEYKKVNIGKLNDKMGALGEKYLQTRERLSDLTYGTDEYNETIGELGNIEAQINATEELISQYKGLTSAYQTWQRAESSGSQRDMYENMIEGFENMDDEISRGWIDDGTIEFLRLIKGDSLSATATTKELQKAYESLDDTIKNTTYSVRDFFTVDEDGNSTNTGVYNFLDAIGQMEEEAFGGKDVVKRDKDGNIIAFDFEIVGGDKAIADALGISEELVQIMVRAADDAGFVISMDGTYQQLDVLKEKAQDAADKLKNTFKVTNFEFNLSTGNEKSITDQYKEALEIWGEFSKNKNEDGTINMDVEGAEEAYTLVSTLQTMVDKLSEPVYMELNATQVEKDMELPLSKLQEYERLTQQENQLKLKGTDTSEIDKAQEEIINYFEGLSPEVQAELGIKGLTREELQAKVEAGEIKIPATVDLQVEMNDTLKDMVNVALYNAGIIDEEELKKRVDIEVYAENVDVDDVDESVKEEVEKTQSEARKANIEIIAETAGVEDVDDLSDKLKDLDDKTVKAIAEVLGQVDVDKLKNAMAKLQPTQVEAIAKAIGEGDVDSLKEAINNLNPTYVQAIAEAFGYDDVQDLYNAIDNLDPKTVEAVANALGITDVESLKGAIDNVQDKDVKVTATTSGENGLNGLKNLIDGIKSKTVTITSWFKKIVSGGSTRNDSNGFSDVDGTAHVNGTIGRAFKQGSWGTKDSGAALGGELGREILVRNGRWFTIGDNGAEFFKYKKGDIIFNHRQTEELLSNGRVTSGGGRGKAFAKGTAFSSGIGGLGKVIGNAVSKITKSVSEAAEKATNKNKSNSSGSTGTGGNDSKNWKEPESTKAEEAKEKAKEFEETFDFIEIAIQRIEREIDKLDRKASSVYRSWSERNNALVDEISKVGDEIKLQQSAAQKYLVEANQVGLNESYAKKIREGSLDIEDFKGEGNEELVEKIKEYQKWYNLYLGCIDAVEELRETEASLYAQRFENIQTQYDGILQGYEHTETMLNEYISQAEVQGHIVSAKYYDALINNEKQNIAQLKREQSDLIKARDEAVASGKIAKNSEEWVNMSNDINSVTQAIEEGTTSLIEYNNAIRDINWEKFDLVQERISAVTAESDFLIELMSNKDLYDDKGKLTEHGAATLGLHGQNYNTHMYQADDYGAKIAEIDRKIASGELDGNSKDVIDKRREYVELQRESILAAEDEKQAIKDLVQEGINKELDSLQELIDKKNESLEAEKSLYEYNKKVQEQTENIASLRKQMASYENDDSEEANAKIQELKASLQEAETELKETEWDKYIQDTQQILDTLYTDYETILNTRFDNIDFLLEQIVDGINATVGADGAITSALGAEGAIASAIVNAMGENGTIKDILNTEATAVGTKLSSAMNSIWSVGEGNAKSILTKYGDGFQGKQTTTNTVLDNIKSDVDSMAKKLGAKAQEKIEEPKTQPSTKANPTKGNNGNKGNNNGDKKPNKPSITDDTIKGIAASIWIYGSGSGWGNNPFRENKLSNKIGASNAKKVQDYINKHGSNGDLYNFWIQKGKNLNKYKYNAFKLGTKEINTTQLAWTQEGRKQEYIVRPSDGAILTPVAKNDSVLNATASGNIWNMANNPAEFIRDNLKLDASGVPNGANVQNSVVQNFENITFSMPNVHGYNELLSEMQKDKNFEKLILSMTVNQIAGKSKLAKNKAIR